MRIETLPSPGLLSNGIRIRIEAAKAISAVEINAGLSVNAGKSKSAFQLKAFFDACSAAIAGFVDIVLPVITSRVIAAHNAKRITLAYSEGLDPAHVPPVTAFAITGQVKTVHKVIIDGPFVHLDFTSAFVAGAVSVAYTKPVAVIDRLQDASGQEAAAFTATAVTNGIV
jgi:hypothetical protein